MQQELENKILNKIIGVHIIQKGRFNMTLRFRTSLIEFRKVELYYEFDEELGIELGDIAYLLRSLYDCVS
jgi:hypothetical protein